MLLRSLFITALVFGLTGCATTRGRDVSSDQLTMRISQLEDELEQKDEEITELREEVQAIAQDVRDSAVPVRRAPVVADDEPVAAKRDGIIRVSVAPQKVQRALKNAGFYTGTVDGKIGSRTKQAILDFQKANNLTQDGILGKKTWDELKTYLE